MAIVWSPRHLILTALVAIVSMVGLMGVGVMVAPSASALDCGGIETSIIGGDICDGASKDSNDSSENPIISVITFVLQILTGAVGIAAVGALVWAGIMYASAGGESGRVEKAKTMITDTVLGVVVYGGMILILNFVIPGGVFGQNGTTGSGTVASSESGSGGSDDPLTTSTKSQFSIVSMPDTQAEINREAKYNEVKVLNNMKWIANNKSESKYNIQAVVAPGDMTNAGDPTDPKVKKMFAEASKDYAILDKAGVPYSISTGNHDSDAMCTDPGTSYGATKCHSGLATNAKEYHVATMTNRTFPTSRAGLKGLTLYKAGEIQNSYRVFRVKNTNWLILTMEYYPRAAVFKWAQNVAATHPTYNIIVVTHGYMGHGTNVIGDRGVNATCGEKGDCTTPKTIQKDLLLKYSNVKILFSGHVTTWATRTDTSDAGTKVVQFKTTVHACMSNIKCTNPMRIVKIDLDANTLTSQFCQTVKPTSTLDKSNCTIQTISGMRYVTSGSSGGSSGGSSSAVTFDGIKNFRDAAASNTTLLKSGLLYRSTNLNDATASDKTKLSTLLNGGSIIDLRQSTDKSYVQDPSIAGVSNIHIPIKGEASAAGYKDTFVNNATARSQFGKEITTIANLTKPVLIHCKSGKDRTGWTVAMIMYIVGDGKYSASKLNTMVMNEYMLSKNPADGLNVEEAWLNTGLTEARAKYGSIMNYIKQGLGVSDATITKLKNRLGV